MAPKPKHSILTAATKIAAVVTVFAGVACRPIKIDKSNTGSAGGCPDASIVVGGTCIKDGFVYLLHDAVVGNAEQSGGKTYISFGKQGLVKGDKLFASSKLIFPKSSASSTPTLTYQLGSANIGTASTQAISDTENVSVLRHSLTHQVAETSESQINLAVSSASKALSNSDGVLLIFRQTQLAYVLDSRVQKPGAGPYFTSDMVDTDKLKSSELKVSATATPVVETELKTIKPGDILLIRSGSAWDIAEGKLNSCEGSLVSWSISLDQKEIASEGPQMIGANRTLGSTSLQTIFKVPAGTTASRISLTSKIDTANKGERNNCVIKISEPTTLSVIVFRPIADLPSEIQNARYLHDIGVVSAQPSKFSSNQSGPPIETLLTLNWDHLRSDALLTDMNVTLASEDRIQQTKAYVQLSRAPDGLSSHLGKLILMSPDKPRTISITEMAIEQDYTTQTKFYLTGMAYNDDAKNVLMNEAQIFFMHFRRIGDRL